MNHINRRSKRTALHPKTIEPARQTVTGPFEPGFALVPSRHPCWHRATAKGSCEFFRPDPSEPHSIAFRWFPAGFSRQRLRRLRSCADRSPDRSAKAAVKFAAPVDERAVPLQCRAGLRLAAAALRVSEAISSQALEAEQRSSAAPEAPRQLRSEVKRQCPAPCSWVALLQPAQARLLPAPRHARSSSRIRPMQTRSCRLGAPSRFLRLSVGWAFIAFPPRWAGPARRIFRRARP